MVVSATMPNSINQVNFERAPVYGTEGRRRLLPKCCVQCDPIIAAALQSLGLIMACLLPLAVCVFVLRQMQDETGDEKVLAELLALELTSDKPSLLPSSPFATPRLESQGTSARLPSPNLDDDPDLDDEPPF